ncbi:MAG: AMIN domain-containing protein [Candidatus Aminicenantes bacterium]|nr:AMIN domain-containing protein [Candidatus Aminicenantes bacterium]
MESKLKIEKTMKAVRLAFFLFFLLVFTWLAYPTCPSFQSQGILENIWIHFEPRTDRLEITLQLTQKTNFNSFSLTEPNRLVIDLFQTERFLSSPQIDVNAFGVQKIRTAINRPEVIRVVLDLQDQAPHHKIEEEGIRIKIELWYELKAELVEPEAMAVKIE